MLPLTAQITQFLLSEHIHIPALFLFPPVPSWAYQPPPPLWCCSSTRCQHHLCTGSLQADLLLLCSPASQQSPHKAPSQVSKHGMILSRSKTEKVAVEPLTLLCLPALSRLAFRRTSHDCYRFQFPCISAFDIHSCVRIKADHKQQRPKATELT